MNYFTDITFVCMCDPAVPEAFRVNELIPVSCLRFATPLQNEAGPESLGVPVTEDFDTAVADCDAILQEIMSMPDAAERSSVSGGTEAVFNR